MRYFAKLAYNGTNYVGWQIQPNGMTVQQMIEESMSTILNTEIKVTGCGRTDAGVHAKEYILHFDFGGELPHKFVARLNKFLPKDIVIFDIFEVADDAHARFNAYSRSYEYHLYFGKNPFQNKTMYLYPFPKKPDFDKMNEAAALLLNYKEFAPFCKTQSDAKTMICHLTRAEWEKVSEKHWVFHITANRFLRGMVRLTVGMCLNIGTDKIQLSDLKNAMDKQIPLLKSHSVPGDGLYLTNIKYPFLED